MSRGEHDLVTEKLPQDLVPPNVHTSAAYHSLQRTGQVTQSGPGIFFLKESQEHIWLKGRISEKSFLCSATPWDALLYCADQKMGVLGRIYYAYVYKITSSLEGNSYIIKSVRRRALWNLHPLISWEGSGHFKKKQIFLGTINVFPNTLWSFLSLVPVVIV